MGEYVTENFQQMKAYTKLEVKLDIFEVYKEAHQRIQDYLEDKKGKLGKIVTQTCPNSTDFQNNYQKTYHEEIIDSLLQEYLLGVDKFNEKIFRIHDNFKVYLKE